MPKTLNMTTGHPGRLLTAFALPLMAGSVFQQLYTVVDAAIVGRGVGVNALAALGTVDWMNWMFLSIAQGFSQGFSVRLAQKFGQRDEEGLKRALGVSTVLSVLVAIVTLAVAQLGLNGLLELLRVPEELRADARLYSRIILLGIPAMVYYNFTASVLRAVGDSRTPLLAMVAAALTNILLDCLAVFLLGWGIAGAAAATVLAQLLSGVICTVPIVKTPALRFGRRHLAWQGKLAGDLMGLGLSVAAQNVMIAIGGMAVQSVVNGFDTGFIAGFTASNKLYGVMEMAAISYGYAVITYTGQNYGAQRHDRIRSGVNWAVGISLGISAVICLVMLLFGQSVTMIFISREDPALAAAAGETAYQYLSAMAVCLPALYLLYVWRSALQGMGDTRIPLLSGVVEFLVRVGGSLAIGYTAWQNGIFLTEVGAWIGAAVLLGTVYCCRIKKNLRIG